MEKNHISNTFFKKGCLGMASLFCSYVYGLPAYSTINGDVLTEINIGADMSYQVKHRDYVNGQTYPHDQVLADYGWLTVVNNLVYTPSFNDRVNTAVTSLLSSGNNYTNQIVSAVSGNGTSSTPYSVTTTADVTGDLSISKRDIYTNGDKWVKHNVTYTNSGNQDITISVYFAADVYLGNYDDGLPTGDACGVGGKLDSTNTDFSILLSSSSNTNYTAKQFKSVWNDISNRIDLDNTVDSAKSDNGAAIQWKNLTIPANGSYAIDAITTFGDVIVPPPSAVDDEYLTVIDTAIAITPLVNDKGSNGCSNTLKLKTINGVSLTGGVQTISVPNGTVNIDVNGAITFTPNAGFIGVSTFPYEVANVSHTVSAKIKVTIPNTQPVAIDDNYTTGLNTPISIEPLTNDSDPDGNTLTIESINNISLNGNAQTIPVNNGTVNINANGVISFEPNNNFVGDVTFPYVITDGTAMVNGTATANIKITVSNKSPVAIDDNYKTDLNTPISIEPLTNDSDPSGNALTIKSINGVGLTGNTQAIPVNNGMVNIDANGVISFEPNNNFVGDVIFPYTILNGTNVYSSANIKITVKNVKNTVSHSNPEPVPGISWWSLSLLMSVFGLLVARKHK